MPFCVQETDPADGVEVDGVVTGTPATEPYVWVPRDASSHDPAPPEGWVWRLLDPSAIPAIPVFTVDPVISGTSPYYVGSTLTCNGGTVTGVPTPTKTYVWKKDGVAISGPGETASTYVTRTGDATHAITCAVTATNGTGSDLATSNTLTPIALTVPGQVTALDATAGDTEVDLTWSAPASTGGSAITTYLVEYRTPSGSGSYTTFAHSASTTPSITVTGLTNGSIYEFRVSAVNAVGTGSPSATDTATPAAGGTVVQVGNTDIRASSHNIGAEAWAIPVTLLSGDLLRFFWYLDGLNPSGSGGATNLKAVLYAASAGLPAARIAVSDVAVVAGSAAAAWVQFDMAAPAAVTAGDYWIAITSDSGNFGARAYFTVGATGACAFSGGSGGYPTPANPFPSPTAFNRGFSAYLEMEV